MDMSHMAKFSINVYFKKMTNYKRKRIRIIHFTWIIFLIITSPCFGNDSIIHLSLEEKAWIKENNTVRVRIGNAPPFMLTDGKIRGIAIDYLTTIFNRNGIQFRYVKESEVTWPQALKYIKQHDVVDMLPTAKITDERKKNMLFTDEYIFAPWVIFTRLDGDFIGSMDDLKGKIVSVEEGYVMHRELKQNYHGIKLKVVSAKLKNFAEIPVKQLATGLVDAYIGNLLSTTYTIQTKGYTNVKVAAPTPFGNHNQAMAIRSDWPELASIINKTLASMTSEEQAAIRNKWLSIRYEYGIDKIYVLKWVLGVTGIACFIIGFVLTWNKRLKTEVIFRKKIETALKDSENRLHSFLNNSPVGIGIWDREFRYVYINEILQKMNGPSLKEHLGKTIEEVLPKAASTIRPVFEKILSNTEPAKNIELSGELPATPGKITHYMLSYFPIIGKSEMLEYIGGIVVDITDIKNTENELRLQNEAIENSLNGFDIVDAEGKLIYANKAFVKMYGYESADEIIGMSSVDFCLDPTLPEKIIKILKENGAYEFEHVAKRKNGSTFDVLMYARLSPDKYGNEIYPTTSIDITKRKKAEQERANLEKKLQQAQKMESIGTLAGGIAHDFNNLLYPIIGFSEMLKEDLTPDSPEHESAQEIYNAGRRGGELVKQILAFSRQTEHKLSPVRFQKILTEVCKLIRSTIPSNIEIHQDIQKDCGLVMAEATQLHQIAMNLITNAYHAVEKASGLISIQLKEIILDNDDLKGSPLQPGQYVMLSVSDNGVGIPKKIMNNIFEPYFTTKEKGKGTGLGLAVVYGILTEHKGDIKAYSEVGKGTTFNVYLPLMKKYDKTISTEKVLDKLNGTERILLVDDEESVVRIEKQMLERLGYEVSARSDSLEALATFNSNPDGYDLVISDMTMPNMTGDQLARELMSIQPDIPIIICTGFSERINKEQANANKVKGFLMKPVVKSEMAQMVRKVLDESKIQNN